MFLCNVCGGGQRNVFMYEKCFAQNHPWSKFLKMIALIIILLLSSIIRKALGLLIHDLSTKPSISWEQRHFYDLDHINVWRSVSLKNVSLWPKRSCVNRDLLGGLYLPAT